MGAEATDNLQNESCKNALKSPEVLAAVLCIALQQMGTALLTSTYAQSAGTVFAWEAPISFSFSVVLIAMRYALVSHYPGKIADKAWTLVGVFVNILGVFLMALSLRMGSIALVVAGGCLRGAGGVWVMYMVGLLLVDIARTYGVAVVLGVLAAGWVLALPIEAAVVRLTLVSRLAVVAFVPAIIAVLAFPGFHRATLPARTAEASASMRVTEPKSFIPLGSTVFVMLALLKTAFCFASDFTRIEADVRLPVLITFVGCVSVVTALLSRRARRGRPVLGLLYRITLICVLTGFLLYIPLALGASSISTWGGIVLGMGGDLARILSYVLLAEIATRNPVDAPGVCLVVTGANTLGGLMGTLFSGFAESLLGSPFSYQLLLILLVAVVIVINFAMPNALAFDEAVNEVDCPSRAVGIGPTASFDESISGLADRFALTPRESEAMALLARGHGAQSIQEHMGISLNTVKMHIRNVYAKLGVHSRQELIDLVEGNMRT